MARHYVSTPGKHLAAIWDQLPEATQDVILNEIRAGLRVVSQAGGDQAEDTPGKPPYRKHVRFERGQLQVLNSARSARVNDAWAELAETARQIQQQGKGR